MLYHVPKRNKSYLQKHKELKNVLFERPPYITITNVCNLSCGGCSQLCGNFKKDQLWFISLDQLKTNIDLISKFISKKIWIFGGEPTLHPKFEEIKEILYSYKDCEFVIFTNGRIHKKENVKLETKENRVGGWAEDKNNVKFLIDFKMEYGNNGIPIKMFNPTLVAPIDVLKIKNKKYYWDQAKKHCVCWNKCGSVIYNDKAYICEVAPAFDQLSGEDNGWKVEENKNPFDKTNEEIEKQAEKFCYRCAAGYSEDKHIMPDQKISDGYCVSIENVKLVKDSRLKNVIQQ
jgi:organic radical activating enzyme